MLFAVRKLTLNGSQPGSSRSALGPIRMYVLWYPLVLRTFTSAKYPLTATMCCSTRSQGARSSWDAGCAGPLFPASSGQLSMF